MNGLLRPTWFTRSRSNKMPAPRRLLTEGPAVDAAGNVFFSDILNNRILMLAAEGTLVVFREPSHRTNGQTFDREGRLLHCEGNESWPEEDGELPVPI
ncbi:MAG: hypothetical protein U1D30_13190 [Planctomycetota bacterium]